MATAHKHFTSATCPACDTHFERLPLDGDEDGNAYAVLEVTLCGDAECGKLLCPCCPQADCEGCDQPFCPEHLEIVPDGRPQGLRCCHACAVECEQCELPAAIPPQSETRPARHSVEVA